MKDAGHTGGLAVKPGTSQPVDRLAALCWRSGYDLTCWIEGQSDGPATTTTTRDPRWYIEVLRPGQQGIGRYGITLDDAARSALAELEVTP